MGRQLVQARIADTAMWLHVWACVLSKLDRDLRVGLTDACFERDKAAAAYFMDMAESAIQRCFHELFDNDDESMRAAAKAAMRYSDTLPNNEFVIPESSPIAAGTGRQPKQEGIGQFPGNSTSATTQAAGDNGNGAARVMSGEIVESARR